MSKYIIEIAKEYEEYFKGVLLCGIADGKFAVDIIAREDLEKLNSDYINENYGSMQDEAYRRGLEDAWEAARKIFGYKIDGGIPIEELGKVFGYAEDALFCTADIIRHNTASEAIAKLKAYEEKQKADDEIKVGDEVEDHTDSLHKKAAVWSINGDVLRVIAVGGGTWMLRKNNAVCTGRHFDIDKILEEMRS